MARWRRSRRDTGSDLGSGLPNGGGERATSPLPGFTTPYGGSPYAPPSEPPSDPLGDPSGDPPADDVVTSGPAAHERRRMRPSRTLAALVAAVVVSAAATGTVVHWVDSGSSGGQAANAASTSQMVVPPSGSAAGDVQTALAKIQPSVVIIDDTISSGGGFGGFGGFQATGAGTGVVISADGLVVTNAHVVSGATDIRVTLPGKGQHSASIVGINTSADLAVIKVSGVSGLTPATFADSDTVKVGDAVLAVGNAEGYGGSPSVSEGIVSALGRSLSAGGTRSGGESLSGLIQTDAAVNPGNSGGPLVDSAGDVIGIVTAMASGQPDEPAQGIGFAIPSKTVESHLAALKAGEGTSGGSGQQGQQGQQGQGGGSGQSGTVAYLGVEIGDTNGGALVAQVVSGGPAASAGLHVGDVVTAVNGSAVSGAADLAADVHAHKPGDKVTLTVKRGSSTLRMRVTLGSTDASSEQQPGNAIQG